MWKPRQARRLPVFTALIAACALALAVPALTTTASAATGAAARPHPVLQQGYGGGVQPNKLGELDCNGFSGIQKSVKLDLACADPHGSDGGRFLDNGHYIGHDEPSMRFVVQPARLGEQLQHDREPATGPGGPADREDPGQGRDALVRAVHRAVDLHHRLRPGLRATAAVHPAVGRERAARQVPRRRRGLRRACSSTRPASRRSRTASAATTRTGARRSTSTAWSARATAAATATRNCTEPVNFGYVQANGVPTGPPSPQKGNLATFTPNARTLLMNPGDKITVHMWDAKIPGGHALEVRETDHTTGKSGFMIASATNGFMNTNPFDCTGTRFNFQPEYNTAQGAEHHPVGHRALHDQRPSTRSATWRRAPPSPRPGQVHLAAASRTPTTSTAAARTRPTGTPARSSSPTTRRAYAKGDTHGGTVAPNLVTGCAVFFDAIGDLDYDGSPYYGGLAGLGERRPVPVAVPAAAADQRRARGTRRSSS